MDFRNKALEVANYKCYKRKSDVDDRTTMFSYIVLAENVGQGSDVNIQVSCAKCQLLKIENLFSAFISPALESGARL